MTMMLGQDFSNGANGVYGLQVSVLVWMDLSWSNLTRMDTDDGDEEEDDGCKADDWLEIELAVMIFFFETGNGLGMHL